MQCCKIAVSINPNAEARRGDAVGDDVGGLVSRQRASAHSTPVERAADEDAGASWGG